MTNEGDVSSVVASLYDAAAGVAPWAEAMKQVAGAVGARSGILITPTLTPESGLFVGHEIDHGAFEAYAAYYHGKDLWWEGAQRRGLTYARVGTGSEVVDRDDFPRSEFYNDFLKRLDIYHLAAAHISTEAHAVLPRIHINLFRPRTAEDFGPAEKKLLALLHPHFERALVIHSRMEGQRATARAFTDVLDRLNAAVVMLYADGRISFANKAADAILRAGDGLLCRAAGLRALARDDDAQLRRAIELAIKSRSPQQATNMCTIARPSGRRPYQLIAAPISREAVLAPSMSAGAMIFIIDPDASQTVPVERIARLLHLTPAEARLAAALAAGASLAEYAERASITPSTARWTLKQVLAKTGTEKQSALIALLLKMAIVRG
jgi:DNA-binding CsgD family transcriptional regulator/PAS domain-containing protein